MVTYHVHHVIGMSLCLGNDFSSVTWTVERVFVLWDMVSSILCVQRNAITPVQNDSEISHKIFVFVKMKVNIQYQHCFHVTMFTHLKISSDWPFLIEFQTASPKTRDVTTNSYLPRMPFCVANHKACRFPLARILVRCHGNLCWLHGLINAHTYQRKHCTACEHSYQICYKCVKVTLWIRDNDTYMPIFVSVHICAATSTQLPISHTHSTVWHVEFTLCLCDFFNKDVSVFFNLVWSLSLSHIYIWLWNVVCVGKFGSCSLLYYYY